MPDDEESRAFFRIVSQLRSEDPRFARDSPAGRRNRGRVSLAIGIGLCALAVLLIAVGGPKGAVLALVPWLAGMVVVIRSRGWR